MCPQRVWLPSGMLTESWSAKEGPEVRVSEPLSPGEGSCREEPELEGRVLR